MNTLIKILPLIMCVVFLAGCNITRATIDNQKPASTTECPLMGNTPDPNKHDEALKQAGKDIYYYISSSDSTHCTVHIVTMSCTQMTYGKAYYIEKKYDDGYKQLEWKTAPAFIEIACIIKTDEPVNEKYSWEKFLGKLESGEYRIVTDFYRDGEKITAYFEFTV